MRTWRVGTISMGASLIFLGLFLFLSKFLDLELVHVMTSWWPILLVVLGLEILLYLFFARRQEQPVLKYDFLSIFFVGILGMAGIGFAILSTTGIVEKVAEVVGREERSFELPEFSFQTTPEIKRIVLTTSDHMTIEGTDESAVSMFGTYRAQTTKAKPIIKSEEDYIYANQKGDTLYLNVKMLPNEQGPFYSHQEMEATILIPKDIKLEVLGNGNQLSLKPRMLENNWSVNSASSLELFMAKSSNVKVSAAGVRQVQGMDDQWKVTENGEGNESGEKNAEYQLGEGKHEISITNTQFVTLNGN